MSRRLIAARGELIPLSWWLVLAGVLALGLSVHWLAALALLALVVLQTTRPLEFLPAYLTVVTAASFVNYTRGQLTAELALLSVGIVFMLICYVLGRGERVLAVPRTLMTLPVLLYLALSIVNLLRGLAAGNSARYAGLEILSVLALSSSLLVANRVLDDRRLRWMVLWLWITGIGHVALGFYIYSIIHVRTGSIYFTPVPGVIAALLLSFAFRARRAGHALAWTLAIIPLLMHQFLSFTRGYWLGLIGASAFSIIAFLIGPSGVTSRIRRVALVTGSLTVGGLIGAWILSIVYGIHGLGELAASRFSSALGTKYSFETSSNIVRLVEYGRVLSDIIRAPIQGHGLGYYFVVREPIHLKLIEQWFVHENYLLVWLKQGLIGLILFIWIQVSGVWAGWRGRTLRSEIANSWCLGTAAASVYVLIYCLVHFPLAEVNTTFLMALLWGGTMSLTATGHVVLTWRPPQRELIDSRNPRVAIAAARLE
jgi:hypothetical protein